MLKNFKPRLYQETILATVIKHNTMVVLPTGMGKTALSLMLAVHRLRSYPKSKLLILAPTRPLLNQHLQTFLQHLDFPEERMTTFSGSILPEKRQALWEKNQIFFSTPQTIENDLISGKISLEDVSLLCFDECHHATGNYAYVFIAKQYRNQSKQPRVLGLTASPGSDMEAINEVIDHLDIEKLEVRTEEDPDVKPYIQDVKKEYIPVEMPYELQIIHKCLKTSLKSKLADIKKYGYLHSIEYKSKRELLQLQAALQGEIAGGERNFELMRSVSLAAEALKIEHALELLETQGLTPLLLYLEGIYRKAKTTKTKAVQNLANDPNFRAAYIKTKENIVNYEHPKLDKLKEIITSELKDDMKIIIFTQFRDTANKIEEQICKLPNVRTTVFVGQASKSGYSGMTQKNQIETLDRFGKGEYNILIMTSVGEEGLDIPQVDIVLFYEPIPSAIRTVQRRGRTGRLEKGRVIVLMTKDTRDEAYRWVAHHKEKRMFRNLNKIKSTIATVINEKNENQQLTNYLDQTKKEEPLKLFADTRERGNPVIKELVDLGFNINLSRLDSADYILSKNVGVEYKNVKDFVDSIVDGRLLSQIKKLKETFPRPLIIIEGTEDIYAMRKVHPNAIRGMLATIAVSYGIPMIRTSHSKETASILATIASREQEQAKAEYNPHVQKPQALSKQQEYFIGSLPNIGPNLAKDLLKYFKTPKEVINASIEDLQKIDKLGKLKAQKMKEILDNKYKEE
ncbi:MAG: DEAD/DEAH box helicase family protein [Nanoarchaeota archaeon]|nr:DEAD/DEAH box helicase family protein [Nanoarchaeota archaeon]